MKKKYGILFAVIWLVLILSACGREQANDLTGSTSSSTQEEQQTEENQMNIEKENTKELGAMTPEDALEYMKTVPDLVIVEVNEQEWKLSTGFTGAMWIPHTEMAERYDEIPAGRPVLIHCGGGIVSVPAYETLVEKRPDIPELSYIAGAPPVKEYNQWLASQQ